MESINTIISNVFKLQEEEIHDNLGPNDIDKWDSLGQMNLIMKLEKKFNIKFEIAEMFEICIVGDIKNILKRKGIIISE
ncbi:putative acyl carrier protein [Desulfamplus magnetovallimortis]|uniref:Putative acyl carrier protein n=1 Tax=Desulfamplus magnetovallimortis TaxID=1246637 RepID=A0A1W1HEJ5_9BACT|nr:acyl carrier protein [Desulfamplus magnetovallimortis]SLM30890.1 putative acyl carrier protein [Desulfamplus magnetovallimortis]